MKLTSLLLGSLFSVLPICKADDSTIEVFLGQTFQSEVCESAEAPPVWKINDTDLINKTVIESYYGRVDRNPIDATGEHWANLTLKHVNFTLDGSVVSCSANSIPILSYTLVVVNTTIKWLAPNGTFTPPVCKSPLGESRPPYWMINGNILNDPTVNRRYGAEITRLNDDSKGRHQAQLVINLMNTILIQNGSNVTCGVGTKLRMVFLLYFTDPGKEAVAPVDPEAESTPHTEKVVTGTNEASMNETFSSKVRGAIAAAEIAGSVSAIVVILIAAVLAITLLCVFLVKRCNIKKSGHEILRTCFDGPEEGEVQIDGIRRAPKRTSEEKELLLRRRPIAPRDDI